jgi:superoxide dismutase
LPSSSIWEGVYSIHLFNEFVNVILLHLNYLGDLMEAIKRDFGSFDQMKEKLNAASVGVQGSGWGWLVSDGILSNT